MKNTIYKFNAFTLVELIVVIVILTLLGTISYRSMLGYSLKARDTNRTTDVKNLSDGLSVFYTKTGFYPTPDNFVDIRGSGITLRKQGIAGKNVLLSSLVSSNKLSFKDPKTGEYYNYVTNGYSSQYQLSIDYETSESIGNNTSKYIMEKYKQVGCFTSYVGGDLGIINENNIPINKKTLYLFSPFDLKNSNNTYTIEYNSKDNVTGTGLELYNDIILR